MTREVAIDNLKADIKYWENTSVSTEHLCMAVKALEQEPKKGHWYRQTNDYVDYYECSKCGMAMGLYDVKNYCPNCGSRNEVEE